MTHIVIFPYYDRSEVHRYLRIVRHMKALGAPRCAFKFLLAASPKIQPSQSLFQACSQVAPTISLHCPTQVFGYPEGPTAMFWDAMDFVRNEFADDGGFSLWFESDMAPTQADWLDRLDAQWQSGSPPLLMGCYVPQVFKQRLLRRKKLLLVDHINGGACYAKHFGQLMPAEARAGVFDVAVYEFAKKLGRVRQTELIDFSTISRVRRDVMNPHKVLLHGFMQDKDQFIDLCVQPVSAAERHQMILHPLLDHWEMAQRRMRVWFVRKGKQAMFENMLLAKHRQARNRAA